MSNIVSLKEYKNSITITKECNCKLHFHLKTAKAYATLFAASKLPHFLSMAKNELNKVKQLKKICKINVIDQTITLIYKKGA